MHVLSLLPTVLVVLFFSVVTAGQAAPQADPALQPRQMSTATTSATSTSITPAASGYVPPGSSNGGSLGTGSGGTGGSTDVGGAPTMDVPLAASALVGVAGLANLFLL
ncbi:MAG: hypothetical protein Q9159_004305 [Coniocarpon cinnabarinum]